MYELNYACSTYIPGIRALATSQHIKQKSRNTSEGRQLRYISASSTRRLNNWVPWMLFDGVVASVADSFPIQYTSSSWSSVECRPHTGQSPNQAPPASHSFCHILVLYNSVRLFSLFLSLLQSSLFYLRRSEVPSSA